MSEGGLGLRAVREPITGSCEPITLDDDVQEPKWIVEDQNDGAFPRIVDYNTKYLLATPGTVTIVEWGLDQG